MFFQLGAMILLLAAAARAEPACGACTLINQPLCGSDGYSYGNQCMFDCAKSKSADLTILHEGDCEQPHGRVARGVNVVDAAPSSVPGPQPPLPCDCPRNTKPVCGNNGQTYTNECLLNCLAPSAGVRHAGQCDQDLGSACDCGKERDPVCGSDGVMYGNRCLLECAQARDPSVHEAHPRYCINKDKPYLRSN